MDTVTAALQALAGALHGMPCDDHGGNLLAAAVGPVDSVALPAAVVYATGAKWAGTGRTDGTANLLVDVLVAFPKPTAPVAGSMAHLVLSDLRGRILDRAGKTLDGTVQAWRMVDAAFGTADIGGRAQPAITFTLELWTAI